MRMSSAARRAGLAAVAILAIAVATALVGTPATAARRAEAPRHAIPAPSLTAPHSVIEGARFAVTAKIPAPSRARTVTLQFHTKGQYDYESITAWTKVTAAAVNGRRRIAFHVRADSSREVWLRAVVTYRGAGTVRSVAARVNYQHWFPLSAFANYYRSGTSTGVLSFQMDGASWNGWYVYGSSGESRYTLGGGCNRLRATVGVVDDSSDGATGRVTLATIAPGGAATVIYVSPDLAAGQTVAIDRALSYPYRFSFSGQDTTPAVPEGTQPHAHPAVGDPEFLCHFS